MLTNTGARRDHVSHGSLLPGEPCSRARGETLLGVSMLEQHLSHEEIKKGKNVPYQLVILLVYNTM